jgi:hypothetical protein
MGICIVYQNHNRTNGASAFSEAAILFQASCQSGLEQMEKAFNVAIQKTFENPAQTL